MDKPPGYWEAYFRDLQQQAQAEFLNINLSSDDPDSVVRTNGWIRVAEGWQELADYHREEGT